MITQERKTEVFRKTKCGLYEVSNYYNIRTTPYYFYKGGKLTQSNNKIVTITDDRKIREKTVTILHPGFGFAATKIYKRVRELFTSEELNIVADV